MRRYKSILSVIAVLPLATWYAFGPEGLYVTQPIHEEQPAAEAANSPAKPVASGKSRSGAHLTSGTGAIYQLADGALVESAKRPVGRLDKFDNGTRWPSFTTQGGGR